MMASPMPPHTSRREAIHAANNHPGPDFIRFNIGTGHQRIDFETPPDLGRFTNRQERIDYLVSTIYCPCGMMGDSCAGHWITLAACKLHGCGMPNLIAKLAGEWTEAGKSDEAILAELVKRYGKNVLRLHQN
jgi:hypothetical protein